MKNCIEIKEYVRGDGTKVAKHERCYEPAEMTIEEKQKAADIIEKIEDVKIDNAIEEAFDPKIRERRFLEWSGGITENEVLSGEFLYDIEDGQPFVAKVYHGTTHDFDVFNAKLKGNNEGFLGRVNYFTSDLYDAENNYTSSGPDLKTRLEMEAERIHSMLEYDYQVNGELDFERIEQDFGLSIDDVEDKWEDGIDAVDISDHIAQDRFLGPEDKVMRLFVKSKNPAVINAENSFDSTMIDNRINFTKEELNEAWDEIKEDDWIKDELESEYDYLKDGSSSNENTLRKQAEFLVRQKNETYIRDRASESIYRDRPLQEAYNNVYDNLGVDEVDYGNISASKKAEWADYFNSDYIPAEKLISFLYSFDFTNYDLDRITPDVTQSIFQELGYDSIVLKYADKKFSGMNMNSGTTHIHIFDEFNTHIKDASGKNKTFDINNKSIYFAPVESFNFNSPDIPDVDGSLSTDGYSESERKIINQINAIVDQSDFKEEEYSRVRAEIRDLNNSYEKGNVPYEEFLPQAQVNIALAEDLRDSIKNDNIKIKELLSSRSKVDFPEWKLANKFESKNKVRRGVNFLQRFLNKPLDENFTFDYTNNRPYYDDRNKVVHVTKYSNSVVHELMHHVEHSNPEYFKAAVDFLKSRTEGEELVPLSESMNSESYSDHELGYVDEFMTPYMGRVYDAGRGDSYKGIRSGSTEVLTMGVEWLYTNPIAFIKRDPEYVNFLLNLLYKRK